MNKIELNSHSVLGYLRVSADKQDVEKQELEIRRYCEKNNLKINEDN
jgi:DNA invertase Pin-like site-specific DNA recombinase